MNASTFLYSGPSLGDHRVSKQVQVLPPASSGDIADLVGRRAPATLVLADGVFYHEYAVGHREIMAALSAGWRVIGVSSMGAIRAAELHGEGMEGYGRAYRYLLDHAAPDDHLALLHEPEPTYRIVAEALFDIRAALHEQAHPCEGPAIQDFCVEVGQWWFADRTVPRLQEALARHLDATRAETLLGVFRAPGYLRAKQRDLIELLEELT